MIFETQNIYAAKNKYKPIYINISLYEELFNEKFDFDKASKKMSDMFSITTKDTGMLIDTCLVDYQACPLNLSLNGNKGSGRAFFYKDFNIKGDKTVLATSTNVLYNNGFLPLEAGLKDSIIANILYNMQNIKPFRTLCILLTGEKEKITERVLDTDGKTIEYETEIERCLEVRYAPDNELYRISNAIYSKEIINSGIYKNMAKFEAFKFINKFLHGSWSFGNISINGNQIDFDTSAFLNEYKIAFTNSNEYKETFFGFEYLGAKKILNTLNINVDFEKEYFNNCYDMFLELIGLNKIYKNNDTKELFDMFLEMFQMTFIHSIDMHVHLNNNLNVYNFTSFFGKILLNFNKEYAFELLFNKTYCRKDETKYYSKVYEYFGKDFSDSDILLKGIQFINKYFDIFENASDDVKLKAFKNNQPKQLLGDMDVYKIISGLEKEIDTQILNILINEFIDKESNNDYFDIRLTNKYFSYSKINDDFTYNIYLLKLQDVDFAKVITDKNEYLMKNHTNNIMKSENISLLESSKILINGKE